MTYRWHGTDPDTGYDYDSDRYERTLERLMDDADECDAVGAIVMRENIDTIREMCCGAYSDDGGADIGRSLAEYAAREWHKRVLSALDADAESAALMRAGY